MTKLFAPNEFEKGNTGSFHLENSEIFMSVKEREREREREREN